MVSKIRADEMKIGKMIGLNGTYFKIPDYQRRYSWKREQLEDFWYDLTTLEDNEEHFLGSIVVITGNYEVADFNELELVDGQQRLTTIMLLLKNLAQYFDQEEDDRGKKIAKKIKDTFLYTENNKAEQRIRLELGKLDKSDYDKIITGNFKKIQNENLINAYTFFKEKLVEEDVDLVKIYDKLLEQMLVVMITADNEKSAFRLFETLNDRGLELSAIDLMKNYLLKVVTNANLNTEIIKSKWENIILNIQPLNRKVRFFRHYIMSSQPPTNNKVTQKKVYDRFKKIIDQELDKHDISIVDYISDMEGKSELYKNMYQASIGDDFFSKNERIKINEHLYNLNSIGASPSRTLLLSAFTQAFNNKIGAKQLIEILDMIETFSIRRIIGQLATGELDTIYNYLALNAFKQSDPVSFIRDYFADNMPGDSEFINNFAAREFRNNDQTKYILDTLEKKHFMNNEQGKAIKERAEVHIEHIAPTSSFTAKKYREWANYLELDREEFEKIKTNIGNLTLLEYKLNIRASNQPFIQKKERYKESNFKMTEDIVENYSEWNKNAIRKRSEELAKIAAEIWSL